MNDKHIELLVRAIIEIDGKILVCQKRGKNYYFLPGGHVEFGESSEYALKREIKEELGLEVAEANFIGGSEHAFVEDGIDKQEINLAFEVKTDRMEIESQEDHLRFFLLNRDQLDQEEVLPTSMKKAILQWFENKEKFWVSDIRNLK